MDIEEMQVIWNSQKEEPVFALDLEALHTSVKRKGRGIKLAVTAMEIGMIVISLALAVILAARPVLKGIDPHRYFGAALFVCVAAHVVLLRMRRRKLEARYEPTLVGDLERAISQVDYHIARARTFQWWFLLPSMAYILVSYVLSEKSRSIWFWPVILAGNALALWLVRLEVRCVHLRKKHDLEALRAKLTQNG